MTRTSARLSIALSTAALAASLFVATSPGAGAIPSKIAVAATSGAAAKYRLNPANNIPPPDSSIRTACSSAPLATKCVSAMITALNHARSVMKEPNYSLPVSFAHLKPVDQFLVLSNPDRALYGRTPIRGLSPDLTASAQQGVHDDSDPDFVTSINGNPAHAGASNWAGGTEGSNMNTPLYAYYEWMYDDGPGSGNFDCQQPGDPGCWGHRDDVLLPTSQGDQIELGAAGGQGANYRYDWTQLFESFDGSAVIPCRPSVITLSTHAIPTAGGQVTINGYGFVQVSGVTVLGQAATIVSNTPTQIVIDAPPHAAGTGQLVVRTSGGTSPVGGPATVHYGS